MYCHVSENFIITEGQFVNKHDLIGYVGPAILSSNAKTYYIFNSKKCNGMTTGCHLHFSLIENGKFINPKEKIGV